MFCMHCHDELITRKNIHMRFRSLPALPDSQPDNEEYLYRVLAEYTYQAGPDDDDELLFTQGEVLAVMDSPD